MIKASPIESSATESLAANSKTLECWSRDPQVLRVELSDGQCFIFPYTHFVFASLERTEDREALHISFTTMTFEFTGVGCWQLLNALQKMSMDWIRPFSNRYEKLAAADAVFVGKIDVQELRDEPVP